MDTFDYQRSSVPARMPASRPVAVPAHRFESSAGEGQTSTLSVRAVLRASRRYWWLILALWIVGSGGVGALVYLKVRPQFHSSSLLKVEPNNMELFVSSNRDGGDAYMQTHVELIKSPTVLSAAAVDPQVAKFDRIKRGDPIQELTKAIAVTIRPNTHLIEVSMTSPSADEAMVLVNSVVNAFLEINKGWSSKSTDAQILKLGNYLTQLQSEILVIQAKIRNLTEAGVRKAVPQIVVEGKAAEAGGKGDEIKWDLPTYTRMTNEMMAAALELKLAEARLEDASAAVEEAKRESTVGGNQARSTGAIDRRINADPEIRDLVAQQKTARTRYNTAVSKAREGASDRAAVDAAQKYTELDSRIKRLYAEKRQQYQEESVSDPGGQSPEANVRLVESEIRTLTTKKGVLEAQLSKIRLESNKQNSEAVDLQFLEEDRKTKQANAEQLYRRLESLQYERQENDRIHQISKARTEGGPISDKRMQYLAIAPVGVLGVVLGLVVLLEIRSGRVADTEVLSARMRHEVFTIAPLPTTRSRLGLDNKSEQRLARFVQSLDHLRVALCEGGTNGEGRCVMITSATGGEGKTTLSAHLAARCANAGTSTLLIDADLRRGSLGRLLDVPPGLGLGDVLAGQAELDANLVTVQAGGFHFLSTGTPGIDPTRVLRSTRLAELIGQLRQMYDLIIIDTPPVLPVADALIVGRWADGAVMAARYDASRLPLVERANRQIAAAGIPVLGVVVNGVKGQDQAYGNYAYNYSYPGREEPLDDVVDAS